MFFLGAHETSMWKWPGYLSLWEVLIPPEPWVETRAFLEAGLLALEVGDAYAGAASVPQDMLSASV